MKRVAIIRCLDVSMRCTGAACMKAYNNHAVKFERYGDEPTELFSMMTCNGCGHTAENDEGLRKKLDRLASASLDVVHMSGCTQKKDRQNPEIKKECAWITQMAEYLEKQGVEIVRGTHH